MPTLLIAFTSVPIILAAGCFALAWVFKSWR